MDTHSKFFIEPGKLQKTFQIGAGGFGTVYSGTYARDTDSEPLKVALKTIREGPHVKDVDFDKEVQILQRASADCDHVCRFYGVTQLEGLPCMVMKLYQTTLQAEMAAAPDHRLALRTVIRRCIDICRGLQELHSIGIIMRDLTPNNVLLGTNGTAVLADFGLAKAISAKTCTDSQTKHGWGNTSYMAPELARERSSSSPVSPKVDIWALGCILVKLTSGTVWPTELSDAEIFNRIYNRQSPTVPEGISPSLADVIRRCLYAQPEQRPSAEEVQKVLEDLDSGAKGTMGYADVIPAQANPEQTHQTLQQFKEQSDKFMAALLQKCDACHSPEAVMSFLRGTVCEDDAYALSVRSKQYLCFAAMDARWSLLSSKSQTAEADCMLSGCHLDIMLEGITECCSQSSALAKMLGSVFLSRSGFDCQWRDDIMNVARLKALVKAVRAQVMEMLAMEGLVEMQQEIEPVSTNNVAGRSQQNPRFELPCLEKSSERENAEELVHVRGTCSTLMEVIQILTKDVHAICTSAVTYADFGQYALPLPIPGLSFLKNLAVGTGLGVGGFAAKRVGMSSHANLLRKPRQTVFADVGSYPVMLACLYGRDTKVHRDAIVALLHAVGLDLPGASDRLSCLRETLRLSPQAKQLLQEAQMSNRESENTKACSKHLLMALVVTSVESIQSP